MPVVNFENMEAVPEAFRPEAKEVDGKVQVDLSLTTKLGEFRDNNVKLMKETSEKEAVIGRVRSMFGQEDGALNLDDIESSVKELRTIKQQVDDKKLVADTSVESVVTTRTHEMRTKYEKQIEELTKVSKEKDKLYQGERSQRSAILLDNAITSAVVHPESKVNASALPDILNRAKGVFSIDLDKNTLTPMKGDTIIYGPEGDKPMTPSQWLDTLITEAPHFAKGSVGGGTTSGGQQSERRFNGDMAAFRDKRRAEMDTDYNRTYNR